MTSISKNVYIDKLDIVNEYNNKYHTSIKTKPVMLKIIYIYIYILKKKLMIKILNLKLVIM